MFDVFAEAGDQAAAGAVFAGEEAAPGAGVNPDAIAGGFVDHGQERILGLAREMESLGVEVPTIGRELIVDELLGGQHDKQLRVGLADNLKASPCVQLAKGIPADSGVSGFVIEVDEFGVHNFRGNRRVLGPSWRRRELALGAENAGHEQEQGSRRQANASVDACGHRRDDRGYTVGRAGSTDREVEWECSLRSGNSERSGHAQADSLIRVAVLEQSFWLLPR